MWVWAFADCSFNFPKTPGGLMFSLFKHGNIHYPAIAYILRRLGQLLDIHPINPQPMMWDAKHQNVDLTTIMWL